MKFLRWKHYGYISASVVLLLVSIIGMATNLRVARANVSQVAITSPTADEKLSQRNQVIEGTAPATKKLVVFDGKTKLGTTNSNSEGDWSFTWESPTPGEHTLRAVIVDGSIYRPNAYNKSAVQKIGINNEEVLQSYDAGLSGVSAIAYNSAEDTYSVVNTQTGTVMVFDATSKEVLDTISYDSGLDTRIQSSYGSACGVYLPLSLPDQVCPSIYDEQSGKLYFMEASGNTLQAKVYVFDTSERSIEATIDFNLDYEGQEKFAYKMYIDPQAENLYVYHQKPSNTSGDNATTYKIDLGTNTLDEAWTFPAYGLVSTANESLYYIQVDGTLAFWDSGTQLSTELDTASAGCVSGDISDLAMHTDSSLVFAECLGSNKLTIVDTSTNNVSSEDADGQFINDGNLADGKLFLLSGNSILNYNATSASFGPEITGYSGFVVPQDQTGFFLRGVLYDSQAQKMYLPTTTYDEGSNTYGSNLYVIDTNQDNPTYNQITDTFTQSDTELLFASYSIIGANNELATLSVFDQNAVHTINTSTGVRGKIQSGLGSGFNVQRSEVSGDLFSLPMGFTKGAVHTVDAATGQDYAYIDLPGPHIVVTSVLSDSGDTLYLLTYPLFGGGDVQVGDLIVYKVDTQTKQVEQALTALSDIQADFVTALAGVFSGFYSNLAASDDMLYYTTQNTLYAVDTVSDTRESVQLPGGESLAFGLPIALSPDGTKIASIPDDNSTAISIRDATTLEEVSSVPSNAIGSAFDIPSFANPVFINDNKILVSYANIGSVSSFIVDVGSGNIEKRILHTVDTPVNFAACIPLFGSNLVQEKYVAITGICYGASQEEGYFWRSFGSYVDIQAGIGLFDSAFADLSLTPEEAAGDISADVLGQFGFVNSKGNIDLEVLSTTQEVTVVADDVSIIKPKEAAKLTPGKYTITGTAPPEKTVTVLVDGKSVGTTQSDEFGAWSKKYTFVGGETTVKAKSITQDRGQVYLHYFGDSGAGVAVVNTLTNQVENDFSLPEPYFSTASFVSRDSKKVYIGGIDLVGDGGVKLFTYSIPDNKLLKTVSLDADLLNMDTSSGVLGRNDEYVYIANEDSVLKLNVQSGALVDEYPLGDAYVAGNSGTNRRPTPVVIEDQNLILAINKDCSGASAVNTQTKEAFEVPTPEGLCIAASTYDSANQRLYSSFSIQVGDATEFRVNAVDISTFEPVWSATLEGYLGFAPTILLSKDGERIYMQGSKLVGGGNLYISPVEIATDSGAVSDNSFQPSGENIARIFESTQDVQTIITTLAEDTTTNKLYGTVGSFERPADIVGSYLRGGNVYSIVTGYEDYTFFGNLADNYIATVPGETLQASRNIQVIASTTITTEPEQPPLPPSIVNPDTPETPTQQQNPEGSASAVTTAAKRLEASKPNKIQSFIANLFAVTKRFVVSVPLPLVNAFPYLLLMLIVGLIAYYLFQTQKELRRQDRLRALYEKQQVLSEEKRNFLELTSHYLRTPLTYIKAGSEMLLRNKQNEQAETELSEAVGHMGLFIESLIEEASSNDQLQEIDTTEQKVWSPLLQKSFWVPVACFAAALSLFYLIFGVIGGVNFGPARYITQILLIFIVVQLFYGMFKNHRSILSEEAQLAKTVNAEATLDHARSKLMHDAGEQLKVRTQHLESAINKLQSSDTSKTIMQQGVDRLSELSQAFVLVSQLENDIMQGKVEDVPVRTLAAEVIEPLAAKFKEKKVKVEISGFDDDIKLNTNKPLAEVTLKTLLENALQATKEGSSLIVKCLHSDGRIAFQVIDHGPGIPKDKIERLFKPFVRVGPVTTFNREGIGLSLYIDRLIMHALGGEIEVVSRFKHGTTATVTFNEKPAA